MAVPGDPPGSALPPAGSLRSSPWREPGRPEALLSPAPSAYPARGQSRGGGSRLLEERPTATCHQAGALALAFDVPKVSRTSYSLCRPTCCAAPSCRRPPRVPSLRGGTQAAIGS